MGVLINSQLVVALSLLSHIFTLLQVNNNATGSNQRRHIALIQKVKRNICIQVWFSDFSYKLAKYSHKHRGKSLPTGSVTSKLQQFQRWCGWKFEHIHIDIRIRPIEYLSSMAITTEKYCSGFKAYSTFSGVSARISLSGPETVGSASQKIFWLEIRWNFQVSL